MLYYLIVCSYQSYKEEFNMNERLKQQLDFILEIDKEKNILRQTHLSGHGRRENDAEHAWHMAIMAYLLKDYANEPVDIAKVMIMCLIHDIVEIDAGDTYAYDTEGLKTQKAREDAAKERIFSLLPEDQKKELTSFFDEFENLIFKGHPLGRNILGLPEQLKRFRSADALDFVRRYYHPSNMVFFLKGNIDMKKIVHLAEKYLSDLPSSTVISERTPLPIYKPEQVCIHKDTHQAHVMIGCRGYNAYNEKRTGLYLLNNMLGGPGMNSRLNVALRERKGLVYNVESNLTSYTDTGVFSIYFGTDPEDVDTCLKLTYKELKKFRENKLTTLQLMAAKKQLIGQIGVAADNFENEALGVGKTFLHYNRFESQEGVFQRIESLTASHLLEIANEIFAEENLSSLIYK